MTFCGENRLLLASRHAHTQCRAGRDCHQLNQQLKRDRQFSTHTHTLSLSSASKSAHTVRGRSSSCPIAFAFRSLRRASRSKDKAHHTSTTSCCCRGSGGDSGNGGRSRDPRRCSDGEGVMQRSACENTKAQLIEDTHTHHTTQQKEETAARQWTRERKRLKEAGMESVQPE